VLGPSFTITKLAWLRETRPDAFGAIRRVLLPHEWLTWQLLGCPAQASVIAVTRRDRLVVTEFR